MTRYRTEQWLLTLHKYTMNEKNSCSAHSTFVWLRILSPVGSSVKRPAVTLFALHPCALHHLFFIFYFPGRHLPWMDRNDPDSPCPPKYAALPHHNKAQNFVQGSICCNPNRDVMKDLCPSGTKEAE